MTSTKKYFDLLGISPTSDLKVIKRAYRKKAMALHPDKNPSPQAQLQFIALTEAYEKLTGADKTSPSKGYQPKSAEEQRVEKYKQAREKYRQMQDMEREKDALYFEKITSGLQWKVFKYMAIYAAIFAILLSVDYFFTRHQRAIENTQVRIHSTDMLETEGELFVVDPNAELPAEGHPTILNYSFLFGDLKSISIGKIQLNPKPAHPSEFVHKFRLFENYPSIEYMAYSSVYYLFPFVHLSLFIPLILVRFKRPTLNFAIGRLVTLWVIFPLVIILTFSNGRIFHLFGLL